ncbi:hypothetical protein [Kribbella sp. VKM Ac-2568]|uniref:hypothetical protein n=1 Tax=Kribbella sp. VKM Ac-2568 TaxID=2512219 RepID=UPI0010E20D1A|nr:hypothetical protein [Kribbella sp. VKM Ac-2568]TCM42771.1 hypothetical protein EV648_110312 [Kribbella sp. VKM Ac-2568]
MCGLFDTTVMLGDDLVVAEPAPLPRLAVTWLARERLATAPRQLVLRRPRRGRPVSDPAPQGPTDSEADTIDPTLGEQRMVADPRISAGLTEPTDQQPGV